MKEFFRCKDCKHDKGKCVGASRRGGHKNCFEKKTMTNADRIRAMSDEELARFLADVSTSQTSRCDYCTYAKRCTGKCIDGVKDWLKQPAEEVQNHA